MASQIAVQMYTLREFTKTPADIASTLKRVKKMGYDVVQLSALGKIDPNELANILKGEGLTCCATHISKDRMRDEPQAVGGGDRAPTMTPAPMLVLEADGRRLLVQVVGDFDIDAATCLQRVAADYLHRGGAMEDVVVDLHRAR